MNRPRRAGPLLAGAALTAAVLAVHRARRRLLVVTVDGSSMLPALCDGDVLLVRRLTARDRAAALAVGRIVVAEAPVPPVARPAWSWPGADEPAERRGWTVKRVAALPGDPWPGALGDGARGDGGAAVGPHTVVLLGDNAEASIDSRQIGGFPQERVAGVVLRVLSSTGRNPVPGGNGGPLARSC
ncbi:S26 family signal peptidase [Streptomyces sp. NPDC060194]|uniref:S26 family signal peptidase n=1 Tax=Streptomyces sp. NPDC060194 TaxID=3347069 RepID=UPI003652D525